MNSTEIKSNEQFEYKSQEQLIDLFNLWYGLKFLPTSEIKKQNLLKTNIQTAKLIKQWDEVWFAKKEKQIKIDLELQKFEPVIDTLVNYSPIEFYEKMAMIILFDQITRNVYRGTSKAYGYDELARKICLELINIIDQLPFQFRLTLLICLCHSENMDHQSFVREYVNKLKSDEKLYASYKEILNTMVKISDNHYTRVANFGRIPERNKFVGRENTTDENIFLNNLK
jgi:uncharacterized protein (DUF924 family)